MSAVHVERGASGRFVVEVMVGDQLRAVVHQSADKRRVWRVSWFSALDDTADSHTEERSFSAALDEARFWSHAGLSWHWLNREHPALDSALFGGRERSAAALRLADLLDGAGRKVEPGVPSFSCGFVYVSLSRPVWALSPILGGRVKVETDGLCAWEGAVLVCERPLPLNLVEAWELVALPGGASEAAESAYIEREFGKVEEVF